MLVPDIPAYDAICDFVQLKALAEYVAQSGREDLIVQVMHKEMSLTEAARIVAGVTIVADPIPSVLEQFETLWAGASQQDQAELRKRFAGLVGVSTPCEKKCSGALFPDAVPEPVAPKKTGGRRTPTDIEFESFWKAYPRKTNKGKARTAFDKAFKLLRETNSIDETMLILLNGVDAYAKNADPEFWCHPTTWLNGGRWEDDPGAIGKQKPKSTHSDYGTYNPETGDEPW